MLFYALGKNPAARILRPTILILSLAGLIFGVLELLLAQQRFRTYVGWEIANYLGHFKYIVGGTGIGAVLCSLFYGHWKSAWLARKTISPSSRLKAAREQAKKAPERLPTSTLGIQ